LFGDNVSESWNTIRDDNTVKPLWLPSRDTVVNAGLETGAGDALSERGPSVGSKVGSILDAIRSVRRRSPAHLNLRDANAHTRPDRRDQRINGVLDEIKPTGGICAADPVIIWPPIGGSCSIIGAGVRETAVGFD